MEVFMKKLLCLLIILVMTVAACSGETATSNEASEETSQTQTATVVATSEADSPAEVTTAQVETVAEETTTSMDEAVTPEEEEEEETLPALDIDPSLKDLELLESIALNLPKSVMTVTESTSADGTVATTTMYSKEDGSYRSETFSPDNGHSVMIYNPIEGNTYVYNLDEGTGIVSNDGPEEYSDEVLEMTTDGTTYLALFDSEDQAGLTAQIETLDDKQVLHLHSYVEEDGYTMDIHHWYPVEYMVALKTEMYMNDSLIASSRVIEYEINLPLEDSLFQKPEGIEFMASPF